MFERLTGKLLWDKRLPLWGRVVWSALILLAPVALIGAIWLEFAIVRQIPVRVSIDRATAASLARQFAEQHGMDANNWAERVESKTHFAEYRYLARRGEAGRKAMDELGCWSLVKAEVQEGSQKVEMDLTPSGKVLGYRIRRGE